jgi:HSP20 family molecular chaperone IbpA
MSRYYSDSDDVYDNNVHASGWQTPLPTINETTSSSVTRIIVECPFGLKKCDYTIDKSQRGRLIITARRRHIFSSDYFSLNNKNNIAIQTFTIPYDSDVDRLQSHIERNTNRLIIEIPRLHSSFINTYIRSPDILISSKGGASRLTHDYRKNLDNNQKFKYRIDCQGYTADELNVFIQDQDLIVHGKTKRTTSSDPTQHHVSKEFSRKIILPNTVDLSKVISYLKNGELRIEAPLKHGIYHSDEEILSPKLPTTVGEYERIQSPIPGNHRRHYRRRERISRLRPLDALQRVRSAEGVRYPLYRSPRDIDDDDDEDDSRENRYRRIVNYERYTTNRNDTEQQQPLNRSIYSPPNNVVTTKTTYRKYPMNNDMYFNY